MNLKLNILSTLKQESNRFYHTIKFITNLLTLKTGTAGNFFNDKGDLTLFN